MMPAESHAMAHKVEKCVFILIVSGTADDKIIGMYMWVTGRLL